VPLLPPLLLLLLPMVAAWLLLLLHFSRLLLLPVAPKHSLPLLLLGRLRTELCMSRSVRASRSELCRRMLLQAPEWPISLDICTAAV
jgi:hypothetical protein